ncbi:MAG: transketolase C-terminal domain-containing protein, partial [Armatimonadota bacterium]
IGRGELLRTGNSVALVAIGAMVGPSLAAAAALADEGIDAAVISARFVKPLDRELICDIARDCHSVVTVEENATAGGFGSAVGEMLQQAGVCVPLLSLGIPDSFVQHGRRELLLEELGLTPEGIAARVSQFLRSGTRSLT